MPNYETTISCFTSVPLDDEHPLKEDEQRLKTLEEIEKEQIAVALTYFDDNRRKVAQVLGLARSTLLAKIRNYGFKKKLKNGSK